MSKGNSRLTILPVVLSGGSGTRLWPLSRELYPKQLLPLVGEHTMLQETILRLEGLDELAAPLVVCNNEHRFMVAEQLRQIDVEAGAILLEPVARNTAPAVAIAALAAADHVRGVDSIGDPLLLVLPADHVIGDVEKLLDTINTAAAVAGDGKLLTFGVQPTRPETGYGYIRAGSPLEGFNNAFGVAEFVEKPDLQTAKQYLAAGDFYWNSGMFLFCASRYLAELQRVQPDMLAACRRAYDGARTDLDFLRLDREGFEASPSDSIDYAVMEKTADAAVVPLDAGWNDVGNWSALYDAKEPDEYGNVVTGDVSCYETQNCYIYAGHRLVTTLGVQDHIVVETADAILIAPRDKVQEVKKLVDQLRGEHRREIRLHREVFGPWGSADAIGRGERYQVNRLLIKPGGSQSLQMHQRRAEHWVVVRGKAEIRCDTEVFELMENQSTYIPVGTPHRIHNPGATPLEIIEIQSGSHIDESDIVRLEDTYGRAGEDQK
ncbi:MAG: mannose-1-phosphate guanylyltransferase/mannose-6-phosphate isomerase [Gammaproteobacteria bacterium]|nr:mannose-1-phosphate guanylyltransferase/mannose-6-phosphate isomerase [Gammaproteobacteria bacterium]MDH3767598.1 mannose-1-phosphate guanylyltransferase/mannose-6-phosphate isomerase [Gammaproteobacteria bacterium]